MRLILRDHNIIDVKTRLSLLVIFKWNMQKMLGDHYQGWSLMIPVAKLTLWLAGSYHLGIRTNQLQYLPNYQGTAYTCNPKYKFHAKRIAYP